MKSSALLAPGLSRPDWTDANAPKCLSQSSFVFVATDTSVALPVHPRPLTSAPPPPPPPSPRKSCSSSLVISLFCLLTFLPRFPTCLARASFRTFWPFDERALNCPVVSARPYREDEGRRRKSWSRSGIREDKQGRARGLGTYVPRSVRFGSTGQTRTR